MVTLLTSIATQSWQYNATSDVEDTPPNTKIYIRLSSAQ